MGPHKKKEDRQKYLRDYMRGYRKQERDLLAKAKLQFGWTPPKKQIQKRKKKR